MKFAWFIARRYLSKGRKNSFISIISLVSILGIAIGVAALIIALALINGFQGDIRDRILSSSAHIMITDRLNEGFAGFREVNRGLEKRFPGGEVGDAGGLRHGPGQGRRARGRRRRLPRPGPGAQGAGALAAAARLRPPAGQRPRAAARAGDGHEARPVRRRQLPGGHAAGGAVAPGHHAALQEISYRGDLPLRPLRIRQRHGDRRPGRRPEAVRAEGQGQLSAGQPARTSSAPRGWPTPCAGTWARVTR